MSSDPNTALSNMPAGNLPQELYRTRNHAQRLADALAALIHLEDEYYRPMAHTGEGIALKDAKSALAQYNESSADADALEALDQLEQLQGGE